MKKTLLAILIIMGISTIFLYSCGKTHPNVGTWHGEYQRPGENVVESWSFKVKNDGTCYAKEEGRGSVNYVREYYGNWDPVYDDVIKLDLETGQIETNYIKNGDGKVRSKMANHHVTYHIRKDGAANVFDDYLDNPRMWLK